MISLEKWMKLTRLQKLPNNVGNLGKMIVATGFELLPKVQKIAQSGHTGTVGFTLWSDPTKHRIFLSNFESRDRREIETSFSYLCKAIFLIQARQSTFGNPEPEKIPSLWPT